MTPQEARRRHGSAARQALALALVLVTVAVVTVLPASPAQAAAHPVMARPVVTAADLVGWYRSTGKTNRATVGIDQLAAYFIQEGNDEGVAGDLAFAQSIVETGYFSFSTRVPPELNNFSGLGAVDNGTSAERFPDARTGVRAQIQHLRAYADPTVTAANLHHPLVDTRFDKVVPKGKAPTWEQFGNGIWATDPAYAGKVIGIHDQIVAWARKNGPGRFLPHPSPDAFVAWGFRDVLFREASAGERRLWETVLRTGTMTPEAFLAELFRGEGAQTAQPVARLYLASFGRTADRNGLTYWTGRRKAGMPLERLAASFIASPEFTNRFAAPTDAEFIDLLYRNVLGRPADATGAAFWIGRLRSGVLTRSGLLVQFSESPEHKHREAPTVEATIIFLGMLRTPTLLADDLGWWQVERATGERLEGLIFHVLVDVRYDARF